MEFVKDELGFEVLEGIKRLDERDVGADGCPDGGICPTPEHAGRDSDCGGEV